MKKFNVGHIRSIVILAAFLSCKSMVADAQTIPQGQAAARVGSTRLANSFSFVPQTAQEKARSDILQIAADPAAYMQMVLNEICFGSESQYPLVATINQYFTPDYQQYTNGSLLDYSDFVSHISALRASVTGGSVVVLEAAFQGNTIADRHIVSETLPDGTTSQSEVFLFGEIASDGRLQIVHEATQAVTSSPSSKK